MGVLGVAYPGLGLRHGGHHGIQADIIIIIIVGLRGTSSTASRDFVDGIAGLRGRLRGTSRTASQIFKWTTLDYARHLLNTVTN